MKACRLLLNVSLLAFAAGGTAHAQEAQTPQASAGDQSAEEAPVDEIVITAQRRTENLMRTPISASILTGDDLANRGVVTVDQLQFHMPSVVIDNFGQGIDFNIRGIGKAEHNTQTMTGVITYRDGVATFPGYIQQEPYFDIASVQVLRGPQGTIAGQNSTGGAVFVNSRDPVIGGGTHGYIQGHLGNYWDVGAQGGVNVPISSTLAARVAFFGERRDSFYDITGPGGEPYTGNPGKLREIAGRISLLWQPTEQLSFLSKTDLDYLDFGAYPATPYRNRFEFFPYGSTTPNPTHADLFDMTANSPQAARDKFIRTSLKAEYEFGGGTRLRSITAYQGGNTMYRADLDGTGTGNSTFFDTVDEHIYSEEVNLISPDAGRFTWLLGAFAQWDEYTFRAPFQFFIGTPPGNPTTEYKLEGTNPKRALAAFGQIGFRITPSLKVEVGGRYTHSRTTNHVSVIQFGVPIEDEQSAEWDNFSYKVSLGWEVDRNNYLYGFVATGFKPGGLNVPVGLGLPDPFGPETVTSYEAGWKANLLDGHLRTTIDGFYNRYQDFQVSIGYPDFPVFGIQLNVPGATEIYGFEAQADLSFGDFMLDGGFGITHSSLGSFFATDPRLPSLAPCDPFTGPESATCIDLEGRDQTYAPKFTFNIGAQYRIGMSNGDTVTPRVDFGHVGPQWATLFQTPALGDRLSDRNILGAQIAWSHGSWVTTLYGTNLTNQHYVAALNSGLDFAGPPRRYGIKVVKTF